MSAIKSYLFDLAEAMNAGDIERTAELLNVWESLEDRQNALSEAKKILDIIKPTDTGHNCIEQDKQNTCPKCYALYT